MNSFLEVNKNSLIPNSNFTDLFFNNPFTKSMLTPVNDLTMKNYYNQYAKSIDVMLKQMIDFDQKLFDILSKEVQFSEKNWNKSNETLKKAFENRLKVSKNIVKSNMEIFDKQLNQSTGINKKEKEEIYAS